MTTPTLGQELARQRAEIFDQLKPLQEFVSAQQKKGVDANSLSTIPWQVQFNQGTSKWAEPPKAGQAILFKKDGSYEVVPASAVMGAGGALGVIENPINNVWPAIPIGSIAVGGIIGMTVGELVDGFVPPKTATGGINFTNVVVKVGSMLALTAVGPQLMSRTGTVIAVAILGAQVLADVLPLDKWIRNIVNFFRRLFGMAPTTTPVRQTVQEVSAPGGFSGEQGGFRNDLYAGIFGKGG